MEKKNKILYLTTAIDYVNNVPHLGHALEKIQADVIARYYRIKNYQVKFLTGTDENSLKNVRAAKKLGVSTKDLVDKYAQRFYQLKQCLNLSFDDFIRTTEARHIQGAQKLWNQCKKDIYKKRYRGLYCVGCEQFYKETELVNGRCPEHKTKPEIVEEENYFFRLSKYQKKIKNLIEEGKVEIIPQKRRNEMLSFINRGLEDICISRSAERACGWGIDVPGDVSQKMWCWFDALSNYITALRYDKNSKQFQKWWQENQNILHIIGKGILRFHAIYWLGILLSAGLNLPRRIFVHGYITFEGKKMSKSLGNIVDPFELVRKYGTDAVRYFLLREIVPEEDGDFTYQKFEKRYNDDLAKGLGNLTARIITLGEKTREELKRNFSNFSPDSLIKKEIEKTKKESFEAIERFKFNEGLIAIWKLISFCDRFIEKTRPWEESKQKPQLIFNLLFLLFHIAQILYPFLPQTSEKIINQLGVKDIKKGIFFPKKSSLLFPRINNF